MTDDSRLKRSVDFVKKCLANTQDQLDRYTWTPQVCDNMDSSTAMGVQHGRITATKLHIEQLKLILQVLQEDA